VQNALAVHIILADRAVDRDAIAVLANHPKREAVLEGHLDMIACPFAGIR